jgi:hypothetical protein
MHYPYMRQIKINVGTLDIATAEKKDSRFCMIAEAIRRDYPQLRNVQVDTQAIRVTDRQAREQLTFMTPLQVQVAIVQFDEGDSLEPFTATLREPRVRQISKATKNGVEVVKTRGSKPGVTKASKPANAYRLGRLRVHGLKAVGRAKSIARKVE